MNTVNKLAIALVLGLTMSGCQNRNTLADKPDSVDRSSALHSEEPEHHTDHTGLPLNKRLAFMSGHVAAGLALYRAGKLEMAAPHLLHPVSETHAAEREGLDKLGFKGELFEAVSKALADGRPSTDIEPQLLEAEKNLKDLAIAVGGDPKEIINYLMDTVLEEYEIGVKGNRVSDMGEYQDAYGFTKVAVDRASSLSGESKRNTTLALNALLRSWPIEAPVPPETATSFSQIRSHVLLVKAALEM